MIRVVLVGWSEGDWRISRQEQWMAEVRLDPASTTLPRAHFDIDEDAYRRLLDSWDAEGPGRSRPVAIGALANSGAIEVTPR